MSQFSKFGKEKADMAASPINQSASSSSKPAAANAAQKRTMPRAKDSPPLKRVRRVDPDMVYVLSISINPNINTEVGLMSYIVPHKEILKVLVGSGEDMDEFTVHKEIVTHRSPYLQEAFVALKDGVFVEDAIPKSKSFS
jgi:hypothetical protein